MNFNAYPFRTSTSKLAVAMSAMLGRVPNLNKPKRALF